MSRRDERPDPAAPAALPAWFRQRGVLDRLGALARGGTPEGPLAVDLDLTSVCNLACPECISHAAIGPGRFDTERAIALGGELVGAGVRGVLLTGGGEPLAHPDVDRILRSYRAAGLRLGLTTNGVLVERHLDALAECLDFVRVSVDAATEATHRRFRPPRGGAGRPVWPAIRRGVERLAARRPESVSYAFLVLTREGPDGALAATNAGEIHAAARLARELGCANLDLYLARDRALRADRAHRHVAGLVAEQLAAARALAAGSEGFFVSVDPRLERLARGEDYRRDEDKPYTDCLASAVAATVLTPHGAWICRYHRGEDARRYGDPTTTPFGDLWRSDRRRAVMAATQPCRDCALNCDLHPTNVSLREALRRVAAGHPPPASEDDTPFG